jgi:hypothetical protein
MVNSKSKWTGIGDESATSSDGNLPEMEKDKSERVVSLEPQRIRMFSVTIEYLREESPLREDEL